MARTSSRSLAKDSEGGVNREASQCSGRMDAKICFFDIGWSDVGQCQACRKEEGTESTGFTTGQNVTKSDGQRKSGSGKEVSSRIL